MPKIETTRTSFELSRKLLARAKARAFDERRDLKDLIAEALRLYLSRDKPVARSGARPAGQPAPVRRRRAKPALPAVSTETLRAAMSGL